MTDRENSPAFQMLPRSARRVFAAIERAIGNGSSASVSYEGFRLDHQESRNLSPGPPVVNDQASSATQTVTSAIKIAISTRDIIHIGPSDTQADLSPRKTYPCV